MAAGTRLTLQNIIYDEDDGCVVHWAERGGCTALGMPESATFRGGEGFSSRYLRLRPLYYPSQVVGAGQMRT
jgi:hypothetical protein